MNGETKKTSPWVYVGIGCGILLMLVIVVVAGGSFFLYRTFHRMSEQMKDPVARAQNVKEILGARDLPEGYHPLLALSLPIVMKMAILSDKETTPGKKEKAFDSRGFIYLKTLSLGNQQKFRDYVDGKADPSDVLDRGDIRIEDREALGHGMIKRDDLTLHYIAYRGTIRIRGDRLKGISTIIYIECPGESDFRMGIWFGPDTGPGGTAAGIVSGEAQGREGRMEGREGTKGRGGTKGREGAKALEGAKDREGMEGREGTEGREATKGREGTEARKAIEDQDEKEPASDLAGTPADESAIREFMSHFAPCGH